MTKEVKRYSYGYVDDGNGMRYLGLIEKSDGSLVLNEDYDALRVENERNERIQVAMALDIAAVGEALGIPGEEQEGGTGEFIDAIQALLAERDALAEKARKFGFVEKAMEALACDEREGGIVTAASLILISSAHRMNAKRGVIDQEGVTFDDGQIGDWRVTIERIDAALQGAQP